MHYVNNHEDVDGKMNLTGSPFKGSDEERDTLLARGIISDGEGVSDEASPDMDTAEFAAMKEELILAKADVENLTGKLEDAGLVIEDLTTGLKEAGDTITQLEVELKESKAKEKPVKSTKKK